MNTKTQNTSSKIYEKGAFTIQEFLDWSALRRSHFYLLVKNGNIKVHKIGRKSIITAESAQAWLDSLEEKNPV